jgi:hypothetical protein
VLTTLAADSGDCRPRRDVVGRTRCGRCGPRRGTAVGRPDAAGPAGDRQRRRRSGHRPPRPPVRRRRHHHRERAHHRARFRARPGEARPDHHPATATSAPLRRGRNEPRRVRRAEIRHRSARAAAHAHHRGRWSLSVCAARVQQLTLRLPDRDLGDVGSGDEAAPASRTLAWSSTRAPKRACPVGAVVDSSDLDVRKPRRALAARIRRRRRRAFD